MIEQYHEIDVAEDEDIIPYVRTKINDFRTSYVNDGDNVEVGFVNRGYELYVYFRQNKDAKELVPRDLERMEAFDDMAYDIETYDDNRDVEEN